MAGYSDHDLEYASAVAAKKKASIQANVQHQAMMRDKKPDMQIVTSSDPRTAGEFQKPRTSQSTKNAFNLDTKVSLKQPETVKNASKNLDFANE